MMKKLAFLPLAALVFAAACADMPTASAPDGAAFAKLTKPGAPTVVVDGESMTVSWAPVDGTDTYLVVVQGAGATYSTSGTSIVLPKPHSSNNWCVKVQARPVSGGGDQPSHFSACARPTGDPEQPECTATVPTITIEKPILETTRLWAPNKRTEPILFEGTTTGSDHPTAVLDYVLSDEYGTGDANGFVTPMASWTQSLNFVVSRRGNDQDGRLYTIVFTITNCAGSDTDTRYVLIPHDQNPAE